MYLAFLALAFLGMFIMAYPLMANRKTWDQRAAERMLFAGGILALVGIIGFILTFVPAALPPAPGASGELQTIVTETPITHKETYTVVRPGQSNRVFYIYKLDIDELTRTNPLDEFLHGADEERLPQEGK